MSRSTKNDGEESRTQMIKLLCSVGLAVAIVASSAWLYFAAERQTERERTTDCQGYLTGIATAMHQYYEKYGHFPPAYLVDPSGKPMHSWRVLLLEFLDHELYEQYKFDEPWDGPNNRKLETKMPSCYACKSDRGNKAPWRTNYFVVVGQSTMFPGEKTMSFRELERPRSSTIMLVESIGLDVHWMEPKDLAFDSMSFVVNDRSKPSVSSRHPNGTNVCMADATTVRLVDTPPAALKEMLMLKPAKQK
jgi:prepilin-type processing-associated H-X9-DG protein